MKNQIFSKVIVETYPPIYEGICDHCKHKFNFKEQDIRTSTTEDYSYLSYTFVKCPKCKKQTSPTGYHSLTTKKPLTITTYYH
jgi:RNase P subunit RPR2